MKKGIIVGLIALFITVGAVGAVEMDMSVDELKQLVSGQGVELGGITTRDFIDTAEGYKVDGVAIIDGDGNIAVVGTTTTGTLLSKEASISIAKTDIYATTTLVVGDSGKTYYLSASGTTITLPAVASSRGVNFRFVIDGAATSSNFMITSAEGDNIEGSVLVAGAVVACDDADVLTFDTGLENLGDFVELVSNGTDWFPVASGVLTTAALLCTG